MWYIIYCCLNTCHGSVATFISLAVWPPSSLQWCGRFHLSADRTLNLLRASAYIFSLAAVYISPPSAASVTLLTATSIFPGYRLHFFAGGGLHLSCGRSLDISASVAAFISPPAGASPFLHIWTSLHQWPSSFRWRPLPLLRLKDQDLVISGLASSAMSSTNHTYIIL